MNLEHFRDAAFRYCQMRGINPDETVGHPPPPNRDGTVNMVLIYSPRWKLVAQELEDHWMKNAALGIGTQGGHPIKTVDK